MDARGKITTLIDGSLYASTIFWWLCWFIISRLSYLTRGLFIDPKSAIGKPARFLEVKQHSNKDAPSAGYALKVNMASVATPSIATKGMIEKIEDARAMAEKHVFEQVTCVQAILCLFASSLQ